MRRRTSWGTSQGPGDPCHVVDHPRGKVPTLCGRGRPRETRGPDLPGHVVDPPRGRVPTPCGHGRPPERQGPDPLRPWWIPREAGVPTPCGCDRPPERRGPDPSRPCSPPREAGSRPFAAVVDHPRGRARASLVRPLRAPVRDHTVALAAFTLARAESWGSTRSQRTSLYAPPALFRNGLIRRSVLATSPRFDGRWRPVATTSSHLAGLDFAWSVYWAEAEFPERRHGRIGRERPIRAWRGWR